MMNTDLSNLIIHGSKYPNDNCKLQNLCNNNTGDGYQITWYENGKMKYAGDFK